MASKAIYCDTKTVNGTHSQQLLQQTASDLIAKFQAEVRGWLYVRYSSAFTDYMTPTSPLFHPNFGGVPFGLDCRSCGSEERRPKAIINRVISFELTQHIRPQYINVTDRQTNGRTDRRTTYDSNTALCTTCIAR